MRLGTCRVWHSFGGDPRNYTGRVNGTVKLDQAGRVVLPKGLRDELRLSPGDALDVSLEGEEVRLRPRRSASPLHKKDGIWVFAAGKPLSHEDAAAAVRNVRERHGRSRHA